jgi:LPXTG-motif cell wall-anchored protein
MRRQSVVVALCAIALTGSVGLATAGTAAVPACGGSTAAQYPPVGARVGVQDAEVQVGETEEAHVVDCTFDPGSPGEYGVQSSYRRLGAFTATATGATAVTFAVPAGLELGTHRVVFRGIKNGRPLTVDSAFLVVDASGDSGLAGNRLGLPRTGQAFLPMTAAGLVLVLVGVALLGLVRRRRHHVIGANVRPAG